MRFSLNFIKEFIKVDLTPEKLSSLLTMSGMEVEHFEKAGDDWIFDIEVTSNRYDWLSILGIAREIAACLHKELKIIYPEVTKKPLFKEREIIIESHKDCPFYTARVIRNVKVEESAGRLSQRVLNCGLNSVSSMVDIINYCMLKWGNPLHAFDEDKLEGNIYVRRAREGEAFIGIDNKEYTLGPQNLVIADDKKVIALAGVMGAKNTEVGVNTKNIFLEGAIFSPLAIRRSRRMAGLDTDSSYRFERKVFADYLEFASQEASLLMQQSAGGKFSGYRSAGKKPAVKSKKIVIALSELNSYLGNNFPKLRVSAILNSLGFKTTSLGKDKLSVLPPAFRLDIEREVDIYEEFIRIYGYDKIKDEIPFLATQKKTAAVYELKNKLRAFLAQLGLKEIITYSIAADKELTLLGEENFIKVTNPLREQENAMRPTLLLGAIKCVQYNLNRSQDNLRFFEIANVYYKTGDSFGEIPKVALISAGEEANFFYLKMVAQELSSYFNLGDFCLKEASASNFANALTVTAGGQTVGFLGKLDEKIKNKFDLRKDLFFAQFDILSLQKNKKDRRYKAFGPYPAAYRDVSIALTRSVKFADIERLIGSGANFIAGLNIINVYEGKDLGPGQRAFTLRICYQSKDRTLTSQEVDSIHNSIRQTLTKTPGVVLR